MSILSSTSGNVPVYRFYLTLTSVNYEVFPLNFNETSIVQQRSEGHAFYRNKFKGDLIFGSNTFATSSEGETNNRRFDFDLLWDIESEESCSKIYLEITKTVSGITETYWDGYFSTSDGKFDLDRCTFTVTPYVDDIYSEFEDKGDDEYNLPDMPVIAPSFGTGLEITTTSTSGVSYTHNRLLINVLKYIVNQIVPLTGVTSTFFTDSVNPVTGDTNRVKYATIATKYDIKNPAGPAATKGMISFNDIMDMLRCMNLRWDYDGSNVIVEHESYWAATPGGLDLRNYPLAVASNKYSYIKKDMPKYEKFEWMESGVEFAGWDIWYDSPCVDQSNESNKNALSFKVTTDIELIEGGVADIGDDGFVLLSNSYGGGVYAIYNGAIPGMGATTFDNCFFAWPYLHDYYFRHGRVLIDGYLNNELNQFYSAKKTKQQEVSIVYCDTFDPSEEITTELGETYFDGAKAIVDNAEISPMGVVKLKLLYGPPDNENSGVDVFPQIIRIIEEKRIGTLFNTSMSRFYLTLSELSAVDIVVKFQIRNQYKEGYNIYYCTSDEETCTITAGNTIGHVDVEWCKTNDYNPFIILYLITNEAHATWDYTFIPDPESQEP